MKLTRSVGRGCRLASIVAAVAYGCAGDVSKQTSTNSGGPPPAVVRVAAAREGTLKDTWSFMGTVRAVQHAELAVGMAGPLAHLAAREGERVERGATLAYVDLGLAQASVAISEGKHAVELEELAQAERELERVARLDARHLSDLERERVRSRAAVARADLAVAAGTLAEARAELERHRVRAPFAGVVSARHVDVGDWVTPGRTLLELVSVEDVEILVDASERLVSRLAVGATANVVSSHGAHGLETVEARVVGVVPALEAATRTARARLTVGERPSWMLPGAAVEVRFAVDLSGAGVVIPRDAVVREASRTFVVRVKEGVAEVVEVLVLAEAGAEVLVSGAELAAGQQLVVRGNERLKGGQRVKVLE